MVFDLSTSWPLKPRSIAMLLGRGLLLLVLVHGALSHPHFLECDGLHNRLNRGATIMGHLLTKGDPTRAPFIIHLLEAPDKKTTTSTWHNYSFTMDTALEVSIQSITPGHNLTNWNHGICGDDPNNPGHGLCQKCGSSLFAMDFDCTEKGSCTFGAMSGSNVLVGTSDGGSVSYVNVSLTGRSVVYT